MLEWFVLKWKGKVELKNKQSAELRIVLVDTWLLLGYVKINVFIDKFFLPHYRCCSRI